MKSFEKLKVWEKSHVLVRSVYSSTNKFPKHELYGLTSQIRRAAVSVPTNIVEGRARRSTRDFIRFLMISRGSLEELEYLLLLASELGYLDQKSYNKIDSQANEVSAMLNGLISSLRDA
jgi:four helix bundle protein